MSTDETGPVMEDALAAVLPDLRARGAVVGWYTSHLLAEGALSPSDVAIHERFFDQPWQVALVVGPPPKRLGGVFRRSARAGWESDPLPFYELLDPASLLPTGRKATDLAWQNYRTTEDAIRADRPLNPPQEQPRARLLFPDEPEEGAVPAARPRWWGGPTRMAAFGAVGLLAAVGLVTIYELGASRSAAALGSPPAVADASPLDRLDRTADTLALALAAFDVRARLFGRGQMGCPELAHGLVEVEERWIAYGAARKNVVVLDSARRARDGSQYAEVDAVERRFERLKCPRP